MATKTAASGEPRRKSARCLFGRPEPEQVSRQLTDNLERMHQEDRRRWNFDFAGGVPMVGVSGDYQFEEVAASDVPSFYRERALRGSQKTVGRRNSSPTSDTVEMPQQLQEQLLVIDESESQIPSTSDEIQAQNYEKPVTRSASAKKISTQQDSETLKQTKLTNYMPVRKRRSETCLVNATAADFESQSVSIESHGTTQKCKLTSGNYKNKGAPKRPLRFVPNNIPTSSVSDSALVNSPRSPPAKKMTTTVRRAHRRHVGSGDF